MLQQLAGLIQNLLQLALAVQIDQRLQLVLRRIRVLGALAAAGTGFIQPCGQLVERLTSGAVFPGLVKNSLRILLFPQP
ncbi:MAG: hypothetical protein ABJH71_19715 [Anderseniella sp.]